MAKAKFFDDNLWKLATIAATSEHANFPIERTQNRDFNKTWHSEHGAGSEWGNFVITAAVNDRLDHKDNGGTTRIGYITAGEYTADELATHIETQLDATASPDTFTVEYLESSNKFKITDDAGNFELLCSSGANKARSIFPTLGYDESSDKTGDDNYTADEIRIHSEERIEGDLGAARDIYSMIIRGHNFQSTATVEAIFSTDAWVTIAGAVAFTVQDDILVLNWDTPMQYQYVGFRIKDIDNPLGYVAFGVAYAGGEFQPHFGFTRDGELDRDDLSDIQRSEAGQESSSQMDRYNIESYVFSVNSSVQKGYFDALFDSVGKSKPFFYTEDPDYLLTTTRYVAISSFHWTPINRKLPVWQLSITLREQV